MDIQVLEYIVTIADCGSISRAAQKLFITQSGLNQQLIKLENRLGIKIFERDNHHLEITPAGQLIVDSATEILRIRRNTLTQLSDLQSSISRPDFPGTDP
ncbi:LysR family transcriptional regulator [Acidaminococcus fermentans]|uniref:LysR family transcriptional regulator n=1 Tax=Acidaminococcus fermentans TaxID=905 RepID=UPI003078D9F4